jgi:DNA replication protein DnaC
MSELIKALKALKLHGMADCYAELHNQGQLGTIDQADWLIKHLIDAEGTDRAIRSIRYQMAAARFPAHRCLADFEFGQAKIDKQQFDGLCTLDFIDAVQNVVLVSGTGTGKTHLATALGVSAIQQHGKRVRFYSTVDLVNMLEHEKSAGKQGRLATSLMHIDLVILDELGYLPFSQAGSALLFHLLSKIYERTSVIITTNLTGNESYRFKHSSAAAKERIKSREKNKRPQSGEEQLPGKEA